MKKNEGPGWFTPMAALAALVGLAMWGVLICVLILAAQYLKAHT